MAILLVNDRFDALRSGIAGKFNFNVPDTSVEDFQQRHGKIYIASGDTIGPILSGSMTLAPEIEMAFIHKDYDELPGQGGEGVMSFMAQKLLDFFLKKGIPPVFTSGEYWSGCMDLMSQGVLGYCRNDMKDILLFGTKTKELSTIHPRKTLLMVDDRGENVLVRDSHMMEGLILREELKGRVPVEGKTRVERNFNLRKE